MEPAVTFLLIVLAQALVRLGEAGVNWLTARSQLARATAAARRNGDERRTLA